MNKLPWFTHDNDAHEDLEIRELMEQFDGLKLYGLWWLLIELLDRHGSGDKVRVGWRDLEHWSMSRRGAIRQAIRGLHGLDKLQILESDDDVIVYEIKKFRERQANLKSKTISKPSENHSKTTQEVHRHNNGENNNKQQQMNPTAVKPSVLVTEPQPVRPVDSHSDPIEQLKTTAANTKLNEAMENARLLELRWKVDGDYYMANIVSLPIDYCQWALKNMNIIGDEYKRALRLRIKLHKQETFKK